MVTDDTVLFVQMGADSRGNRLFTYVRMNETGNVPGVKLFDHAFLETADG
jgi:hypothetical protein